MLSFFKGICVFYYQDMRSLMINSPPRILRHIFSIMLSQELL